MIYDCFTFFNELDLLEIRLNVLKDVVDKFVIAEATRTHRGKPKELLFEKNRERYAAFADKITYIVVDDLLPEEEVNKDLFNLPWVNENRQRNALKKGLNNTTDFDIIMVSDLDEIPRPEKVLEAARLAGEGHIVRFVMDAYAYFINFRNYQNPKWLLGTQAISVRTFKQDNVFDTFITDRFSVASECQGRVIQKIRFVKPTLKISNGGWHFSYLGGVDAIINKLSAFAHSEASSLSERVAERLSEGKNIIGGARDNFAVPIDDSFPGYVVENIDKYSSLCFKVDKEYLHKTAWLRLIATLRGICYRSMVKLVPSFLVGPISKLRIRLIFK